MSSGKVRDLMEWLSENAGEHLTAAQVAQYLVLQAVNLNGTLGRLLESSLKPIRGQGERVRSLMPLPLWPDVRDALEAVIAKQRYKDQPGEWRERGNTKTQASRALRTQGALLWHGLVVVSLNWLHSGGNLSQSIGGPAGRATSQQEIALCRLWDLVKVFVDEKPKKGGVPRTPQGDWAAELETLRVSYTGEVVQKARPLTLEQVLPGLPSPQHGGLVDILEVVDEKLKRRLQRPDLMLREAFEDIPTPQVMCADDEWEKVVKALYDRHLVVPVERNPVVDGKSVLNGAFGVIKPDRLTESGLPVLRMIMDLRASNTILEQLEGDCKTLSGAACFQKIVMEEGEELLLSGDDLNSAFYLFRLPIQFSEYLVLRKPVRKSLFQAGQEGTTLVGITVLPMGWSSAVAIMQCAHRQLALRSEMKMGAGLLEKAEIRKDAVFPALEDTPAWTIYLDDTTIIEKVAKGVSAALEGKPAEEQSRLRKVYEWWGIPTNASKALERVRTAERLGALIDGEKGVLRVTTKRCLDLMSLGAWLRKQGSFPTTVLQIYAGKAVHILQFRRCLFSVLQEVFVEVSQNPTEVRGKVSLFDEMMLLECLLPVVCTDLKARIDPIVTASDACESGGGATYASRLSRLGEEELERLMEEDFPEGLSLADDFRDMSQKIVVIDLFAGVGGLERALQHAKIKPWFVVAVESDADCRRCLRRRFPGLELCTDIRRINKRMVQDWLRKIPDANGVICGGGSPCQGLSRLSADRTHLEDPRSALFFEAVRVMDLVKEVADAEGMWNIRFLENVADEEDIRTMSWALSMRPLLVDSQHLSRARRPRLFWVSVPLVSHEEVEVHQGSLFDEVVYGAATEPMHAILTEGWTWTPGERDSALRFPTFTRAIARKRPPKEPAGLASASESAKSRWEADQYRFPPYTYNAEYMIEDGQDRKRPLLAAERELLMGFERNHTLDLARKVPETQEEKEALEDQMSSALGNAFHTTVVGALLDHVLWSFGVKQLVGHHEIVDNWSQELKRTQRLPPGELDIAEDQAPQGEDPGYESGATEKKSHQMEKMELPRTPASATAIAGVSERDLNLSVAMVQAFVRRQEYRGSDVRLDVGTLYRPDAFPRATVNPHRWRWHEAHSYPFQDPEHINILELRALIHTVEWRLRKMQFNGVRFLHLCDSQVALSVCVKGRSSNRQLNKLLRRLGAMSVAAGLYPVLAWIESHLNPADEPSRRYEP